MHLNAIKERPKPKYSSMSIHQATPVGINLKKIQNKELIAPNSKSRSTSLPSVTYSSDYICELANSNKKFISDVKNIRKKYKLQKLSKQFNSSLSKLSSEDIKKYFDKRLKDINSMDNKSKNDFYRLIMKAKILGFDNMQ